MRERLIERANAMGISLNQTQADAFCKYHEMLTEANRRMNLTRISEDPDEAIDRNYLDSISPLAGMRLGHVPTLADVGSGAGFPGIPLAILLPDTHITLIDALDKRVGFLREVISELSLNAEAVHARCEDAGRQDSLRESFDVVTSRAVAQLNVLAELSLPLIKVGGQMLAYKGPAWQEEVDGAENALRKLGGQFEQTVETTIPGRDWHHVLVAVRKVAPTPAQYPRRAGTPEKKPL